MAISTSATIHFWGTPDEVTVATPATVNAGAFSVEADTNDWTNDDDAPMADFVLEVLATSLSAAPTAGDTINLYTRIVDVTTSAEDTPIPDANFPHYYLGSFAVDNVDADQRLVLPNVVLPNVVSDLQGTPSNPKYHFYIENNMTSVNLSTVSDGWSLWVIPKAFGPHA